MASERLQVKLELETGQYKREAREAATATSQIGQSAQGAATSTGQLDSSMGTLRRNMPLVAGAAGVFIAGKAAAAISDFVNGSIEAYSDLNESQNAVTVSFGENAEGIAKLGREAATSLGLSNAEFNSLAVSMSAFVDQIAGEGGDVVGTMDELTTRASDFASVMNLEVDDAMEKFRSGLAGETEPLRKFGIDVSAARVEAFALANGISDGNDELTEGEKVQARYGLIMEQTAKTAGDFANTSDELANQTRITNAQIENQRAIVGETLQAYKEWGNVLSLTMGKALAQFAIGIQEVTGEITTAEGILKRWEIQTGTSVEGMDDLVAAWQELNAQAEEWRGSGSRAAQRALMVEESLDGMVRSLDLTTDELLDAVQHSDSLAHQMGLTADQAVILEQALREELAQSLNEASTNFARSGGAAREWREAQEQAATASIEAIEAWKEQLASSAEATDAFKNQVISDLDEIVTGFKELPEESDIALQDWIDNMNNRLEAFQAWHRNLAILTDAGLDDFVNEMREAGFEGSHALVQEAVDSLAADDGLAQLANQAAAQGENVGLLLARGIALGIDLGSPNIIEAAQAAVTRAANAASSIAQIESPSKLFAKEVGEPISQGIAQGITSGGRDIESAIGGVVEMRSPASVGSPFGPSSSDFSQLAAALSGMPRGDFIANFQRTNDETDAQLVGALRAVQRRMETL